MKSVLFILFSAILSLLTTTASAQWVQTGPYNESILCFAEKGASLFAGAFGGGVFLSSNNGASWTAVNNGLSNTFVSALAVSGNNIFAGTDNGIFLSTNNGTNWTHKGLNFKLVQTVLVNGSYIYAGTFGDGAYLSTNNGTSWIAINSLNNNYVICFANIDSVLYAGTHGGGVYKSTNHGTNWASINNGLSNKDVRSLAIVDTNLFAGTYGGGIFITENQGESWVTVNNGLSNKNILPLTFIGHILFAGTVGGGVFLSIDKGASWREANDGLTNLEIPSLKVMGVKIFAGTINTGIWSRTVANIVSSAEDEQNTNPDNFYLSQNYPNPFNPITSITFSIPKEEDVTLSIFNTLGKEIINLVSEKLPGGIYTKNWDATGMTSGVYFYILQAGSYIKGKKMILLK